MSVGPAATTSGSLGFTMGIPLANGAEFYAFGLLSYKDGLASGFYRFPHQNASQSGLYDQGFSPKIESDIQDQSLSIGFSRDMSNWKIDISNTIGRNALK